MADRGFTISDLFEPLGVELLIPTFLKGCDQLTTLETKEVNKFQKRAYTLRE